MKDPITTMPFYNRQGEKIDDDEWSRLFNDSDYKIVKQQNIHGNKVSTVWLGTDYAFGMGGAIIIFETLVFGDGMWDDYSQRWSTEEEALTGHSVICNMIAWWHTKQIGVQEWVRVRDPSYPNPIDEIHT
jgi:hypothetical protein